MADAAGLEQALLGIKLSACPHCRKRGALIGHGWLYGYAERGQERVVRGRRFFCSSRFRRAGCGRTFSVLLMTVIAGFSVRAHTLFRFVEAALGGLSRSAAWQVVAAGALSLSSGYRLWRRVREAQSALRARLCRQRAPPACLHPEPLAALLAHFRSAFPDAVCPFSSLQAYSQQGLFD